MADNVIRVSIPNGGGGYYNALTDTNLDHFALYTDQDNILVKEHSRGTLSCLGNAYPSGYPINHNLGYVPLFLVYAYDYAGYEGPAGNWLQVGDGNLSIWVAAISDANTLTIYPDGNPNQTNTFKWYIFYDNIVGSSGHTITESANVLKVGKAGVNVLTSIDPNDYIFHSDLNTFKIIKEGTATISYTANGVYSFNHNAGILNPAAFQIFVMFPDGSVTMGNGTFACQSRNGVFQLQAGINTTQISCKIFGDSAAHSIYVKYYIYETPLT